MRLLKSNARVLLIVTLVVTALALVGLMMVPQQGKKFGIAKCSAGNVLYSCECPSGYNDSDGSHDSGDCYIEYGKTSITCETNSDCWNHYYDGRHYHWYSKSCEGKSGD
jgi:hypothetical protein